MFLNPIETAGPGLSLVLNNQETPDRALGSAASQVDKEGQTIPKRDDLGRNEGRRRFRPMG